MLDPLYKAALKDKPESSETFAWEDKEEYDDAKTCQKMHLLPNEGRGLEIAMEDRTIGVVASNCKLYLHFYVKKLSKNLSQRIGILKKIRSYLPMTQRLLYYNSMIRSVLLYISSIWTSFNKESLGCVLKLQKRASRVTSDADNQASNVKLFNRPQWLLFL